MGGRGNGGGGGERTGAKQSDAVLPPPTHTSYPGWVAHVWDPRIRAHPLRPPRRHVPTPTEGWRERQLLSPVSACSSTAINKRLSLCCRKLLKLTLFSSPSIRPLSPVLLCSYLSLPPLLSAPPRAPLVRPTPTRPPHCTCIDTRTHPIHIRTHTRTRHPVPLALLPLARLARRRRRGTHLACGSSASSSSSWQPHIYVTARIGACLDATRRCNHQVRT